MSIVAVLQMLAVLLIPSSVHAADAAPVGSLAASVTFGTDCASGVGVGVAFDGHDLWCSCYESSPDLFRADPVSGKVLASYDISGGLGAIAYDLNTNTLWAGWGNSAHQGEITAIHLDGAFAVTGSSTAFSTCPQLCFSDIDDGIAYDGANNALFVSPDTSQVIMHYRTDGTLINDGPSGDGQYPFVGGQCYNTAWQSATSCCSKAPTAAATSTS